MSEMATSISCLKPIHGHPILNIDIDSQRHAIIADLHIGLEYEFRGFGIKTMDVSSVMVKNLILLCVQYGVSHLYLLGDIKHTIPHGSKHEYLNIRRLFKMLHQRGIGITVIKGNHDSKIESHIPDYVELKEAYLILNRLSILLTHGHRKIDIDHSVKTIVLGHIHPGIKLDGKWHRCWLIGNVNGLDYIIMPAFNPYAGTYLFGKEKSRSIPILPREYLLNFDIYLTNGFYAGKVHTFI